MVVVELQHGDGGCGMDCTLEKDYVSAPQTDWSACDTYFETKVVLLFPLLLENVIELDFDFS